jgi:protein-S-isoprenylcysteine O-methyltransferase Ste14
VIQYSERRVDLYLYLVPLLIGFIFNWASAFTDFTSRRYGGRRGRLISFITRNILGIPVWVIGLILAFRESARPLFIPNLVTDILGWLLVVAGTIPMFWGLAYLGRRSYRPSQQDTLVSTGIYNYIRHPIYSGVLLEFVGGPLLHPKAPAVLACLLGLGYVYIQARLEEFDLIRRIPSYRQYMNRVPRFFPRLRKR